MRIAPLAAAGLVAFALATAGAAHADPRSDVQELQQQISELHDSWEAIPQSGTETTADSSAATAGHDRRS